MRNVATAWLGAGVGVAAGAVVLGGYGFALRTPTGIHDTSVTKWFAASAVLLTALALALTWITRSALRGADATRRSAQLLAVVVVATFYVAVSEHDELAAGTPTGMMLLRSSWAALVVATVFLVAGAVAAAGRSKLVRPWRNHVLMPAVAVGLILVLIGGAVLQARADTAMTALPVDIPAVPTTVGADVAYSLPITDPSLIVPAGPGFVVMEGDALVGYSGETGQQRWRFPFAMVGLNCESSSVRSTGTAADAVVIAQCLRPNPTSDFSSSASDRPAVLTGIDAMTGRVLWTNADNWRIRSTVVTGPDVVPVLRGGEVGALDPRTGSLRWTKQFDPGECDSNIVGLGGQTQRIVYFAMCASHVVLHVADGRTGAERSLPVTWPELGADVGRAELLAAAGNVVVIAVEPAENDRSHAVLAVDIDSGDTVAVPAKYLWQDRTSFRSGQYPGPVLQLTKGPDGATVYLVAERRALQTSAPVSSIDDNTLQGQRWAVVGDQLVTATAVTAAYRAQLATVTSSGLASGQPSPCGRDAMGGVVVVPGALLAVCALTEHSNVTGYVVKGLR